MKKCTSVILLLYLLVNPTLFGQVGIGTNSPDSSAVLELQSTNQGFLMSRLTTVQQLQINDPATGLLIFNIDSLDFWYFTGGLWLCMQNQIDTIFLSDWFCGMNILYEGQYYHTVQIGSQCWLKENLRASKYRDGSTIPQVTSGSVWSTLTTGAFCWYNNDSVSNENTYGKLYNWFAVIDVHGLCPTGWHIPTDAEFTVLSTYLGGESVAGGKMKEAGLTHWASPNTGATNESGFTALPGGLRYDYGYLGLTYAAYFWSSSQYDATYAWSRGLHYDGEHVGHYYRYKAFGFSARCVQD